jgi:Protein of unknown function (DUF2778)
MSTSISAFGLAAHNRRRPSRKAIPNHVFGAAAIAGLVLGCAWTVYSNVFGASIYPSMAGGNFDAPVIEPPAFVVRSARPAASIIVAALPEPPPVISAPATVPSAPLLSFDERFAAAAPQGVAPRQVQQPKPQDEAAKLAEAAPRIETPMLAEAPRPQAGPLKLTVAPKPKEVSPPRAPVQVAAAPPVPPRSPETTNQVISVRDMAQRAKAAVLSIAANDKPTMVEKLWGKEPARGSSLLSYASADASVTGSIPDTTSQNPMYGGKPPYDKQTAVYDIAAKTVYLPDGSKLEAHSGLGAKIDDVRFAHVRMQGVTPPHIYELKPREALFHGVPALRLTPIGGQDKIFNRDGLLAHTYMLGNRGDSNGCVSFKDYYAFLNAYRNQGIRRLAVLAKVE